jgi:hypothetical protein
LRKTGGVGQLGDIADHPDDLVPVHDAHARGHGLRLADARGEAAVERAERRLGAPHIDGGDPE